LVNLVGVSITVRHNPHTTMLTPPRHALLPCFPADLEDAKNSLSFRFLPVFFLVSFPPTDAISRSYAFFSDAPPPRLAFEFFNEIRFHDSLKVPVLSFFSDPPSPNPPSIVERVVS